MTKEVIINEPAKDENYDNLMKTLSQLEIALKQEKALSIFANSSASATPENQKRLKILKRSLAQILTLKFVLKKHLPFKWIVNYNLEKFKALEKEVKSIEKPYKELKRIIEMLKKDKGNDSGK